MGKRESDWLSRELPDLVSLGYVSPENAVNIENHYRRGEQKNASRSILIIFSSLGAISIGIGVILLFAFNWKGIPRPARTCLAFGPLLAAMAFSLLAFLKKRDNPGMREGASLFHGIALMAAMALVSQIYHIPGELDVYLLSWSILILPLIYLLNAKSLLFLYLAAISAWAGYAQAQGGNALLFWPLFLLAVPRLALGLKKEPFSASTTFNSWAMVLCLCAALGVTLEKVMPGLWLIIYSAYFAALWLCGKLWFDEPASAIQRPFGTAGMLGGITLAFLLTYSWPWHDIGWRNIRTEARFQADAAALDYVLLAVLFSLFIYLLAATLRKKRFDLIAPGILPLLVAILYSAVSSGNPGLLIVHLVMNAYILALGLGFLASGFRERSLASMNLGTFVIIVQICLRFIFVEGFFSNLITRGILFILLGSLFIAANIFFSRRLRKANQ